MLKGSVDNSQCNRQRTPTKEIKSSSGFCSGYLFKFFSSIRTDQTLVVIHKGFVICIKEGRTQKKTRTEKLILQRNCWLDFRLDRVKIV